MNEKASKPVAIVLGGTNPHTELCRNLKNRGFYTLLVDYYENPPAKAVADEHIQESALDASVVEEIARNHQAGLIITAALDQPLPVAIAVSGKLRLPRPFDDAVAHTLTNKTAMKRVLDYSRIPTPGWRRLDPYDETTVPPFPFPVIVKPEDGTGSRGITIVEHEEAFHDAVASARAESRSGLVLVEEYIMGKELSVDCTVSGGNARVILCRERHKANERGSPGGVQCVATAAPAELDSEVQGRITNTMSRLATAFGIQNGVMLVQLIIKRTGELSILEIAGRVSGGPGGFITVRRKTGVDLLDCVVRSYLGEPIESTPGDDGKYYASGSLYCAAGVFDSIVGVNELLSSGIIETLLPYKAKGDEIPVGFTTKNRAAGFAVAAESRSALRDKLAILFQTVDVLDPTGRSLLLRQVGLHHIIESHSAV